MHQTKVSIAKTWSVLLIGACCIIGLAGGLLASMNITQYYSNLLLQQTAKAEEIRNINGRAGLRVNTQARDDKNAITTTAEETSRARDSAYTHYVPAPIEDYIIQNAHALGYNTTGNQNAKGCTIWTEPDSSTIYKNLTKYLQELKHYNIKLLNFKGVPDLRLHLEDPNICNKVELHSDGLKGIFKSGQLSLTSSGYVEPLLPPMRHPGFCWTKWKSLFDMGYLVHDFGAMCRQLKRHSRTILIDMGASLEFHGGATQPAVYLTEIFEKFGFPFDHIYAYEMTQQDPQKVYELIPDKLQAAYHWINVAVDPTEGARLNPLTMLLSKYNKDDLIVVKLDVDTPSVELPLAKQLLEDARFGELVDQFYFEHHVHLEELNFAWGKSSEGSVKDSLDLFFGLRQKGIPAHFWP